MLGYGIHTFRLLADKGKSLVCGRAGRNTAISWKRLPGRPRKTWTSQIPDDTGMSSRAYDGMLPFVVAMEEGRYGLRRLCADDDVSQANQRHSVAL